MAEAAAGWAVRTDVPSEDRLIVSVSGRWTAAHDPAAVDGVLARAGERTRRVEWEGAGVEAWDSTLLTFVRGVNARCAERGLEVVIDGLPRGVQRLLELASSVPQREKPVHLAPRNGFLAFVGNRVVAFVRSVGEILAFLGEVLLSAGRSLRGRAVFRPVDLWLVVQETGAHALPIVSLINVLVGLILAFVGAYQLRMFGAEVYIAAGVGLAMVREMAPVMTGVLLAGRTGAAFAAQIGSMQLNEEVDALQTMGISAFDFLVLPRVIAMAVMTPMLCLYGDLMGIVGGAVVGSGMFGIPLAQYFQQTWEAVQVTDLTIGVVKSMLFGIVIAVSGCMRGMHCGRNASAVGEAATSAVVTAIVGVIVIDSLAAVMSTLFGF